MKRFVYYFAAVCLLWATACSDSREEPQPDGAIPDAGSISEGYFVATFNGGDATRTPQPTTGDTDTRVQHIRYLLFDASGDFVKERVIWTPTQGTPTWPMSGVIRDTLPKGSYKAVFLANVEKTLFPYKGSYYDVLTGYTTGYANARILLPRSDFSSTTEYYMGKVDFSNTAPNPSVYLQRIIGAVRLQRNAIDAQGAINTLTRNIIEQVHYRDQLIQQVRALLPALLTPELSGLPAAIVSMGPPYTTKFNELGGVSGIVTIITEPLIDPLVDNMFSLLNYQVGANLTGYWNTDDISATLGVMLNPWTLDDARTAVVTINDFPKEVDFDLRVTDKYTGLQRFAYDFPETSVYAEKNVYIRGFGQAVQASWDIRNINVIKQGLASGLVVDQIADDLLLKMPFVEIHDPLTINASPNIRYRDDYSLLDVKLKDYTELTDNGHNLSISVQLAGIPNLDALLRDKLGVLTSTVIKMIYKVQVTTVIHFPLLEIGNVEITGSWGTPEIDQ